MVIDGGHSTYIWTNTRKGYVTYVVVDGNGIFLTGNVHVKAVWNFVVVNVAENSLTTIS